MKNNIKAYNYIDEGVYHDSQTFMLILSCANRKIHTNDKRPAIELYDGPVYRALRKRWGLHSPPSLDIFIISAKYGLIKADSMIEYYDQKMTHQRALELHDDVLAGIKEKILERRYQEVYVNLGSAYRTAVEGIERLIPDGTLLLFASGGIGKRTAQVLNWLSRVTGSQSESATRQ